MGEGGEGAGFTLVRRGVRRVGPDGARESGQQRKEERKQRRKTSQRVKWCR